MSTTTQPQTESPTLPTTTMRTLVGVDADDRYVPALGLLSRLRFAGNRLTLAHIEPPVGPQFTPAPIVYDYYEAAELESTLHRVGETLLEDAASLANRIGLGEGCERVYKVGSIAPTILQLADERRSDLVAIGSHHHGALQCFFLGSVGRALAIGADQSFLIARGELKGDGKVKAVFATDHSEYANRCFARLLDMRPEGLGHVVIATATESTEELAVHGASGWEDRSDEALGAAETEARRRGGEMVDRLAARGISAEYQLIGGVAEEGLRRAMEKTNADLLILGAKGHGFFERLVIGSLALHEVVAEQYSVLVIRIPEAR